MKNKQHSMLQTIEETSKAVRSGPVGLRRAVEVEESRRTAGPRHSAAARERKR
jgi:hypothetical protein